MKKNSIPTPNLLQTRKKPRKHSKSSCLVAVAGIRLGRDFLAQTDADVKKMNLDAFITTQFSARRQKEGLR